MRDHSYVIVECVIVEWCQSTDEITFLLHIAINLEQWRKITIKENLFTISHWTHSTRELPAVSFHEDTTSSGKSLSEEVKIFVTPSRYFTVKFRHMFTWNVSGEESLKWLEKTDTRYRPQRLNFAFWCATSERGILSRCIWSSSGTDEVISDVSCIFHC